MKEITNVKETYAVEASAVVARADEKSGILKRKNHPGSHFCSVTLVLQFKFSSVGN